MASIVEGYIDRIKVGNGATCAIGSSAYGVCNSGANDPNKTVDISGFNRHEGATIHVKFLNENSVSNPTLNVNNTGAASIVLYSGVSAGTDADINGWQAGAILTLTYDGTYWIRDYNTNATYSSLAAEENGLNVSLVTTGEKYNWNSIVTNAGTVTSIIAGTGLTGGTISTSGTIAANLKPNITINTQSQSYSSITNNDRVYAISVDSDGYLATYIPWEAPNLIIGSEIATTTSVNNTGEVFISLLGNTTVKKKFKLYSSNNALTITNDANGNILFTATTFSNFTAPTNNNPGTAGLVPAPTIIQDNSLYYFLRADGTWAIPQYFTLSAATTSTLGGIQLGYSGNTAARNYAVQLDNNNKAYVNVPWSNTDECVLQTDNNDNFLYKLLFANTTAIADSSSSENVPGHVYKSEHLLFNPYNSVILITDGTNQATLSPITYSGTATNVTGIVSIEHGGTGYNSATSTPLTNLIFAGPYTGTGAPSFRSLHATDIPNISWNKITSDKPTTLSGYGITDAKIETNLNNDRQIVLGTNNIVPIISVNGHTGSSVTLTAGDLNLSSALRFVGITTSEMSETFYGIPQNISDNYIPIVGDVVLDGQGNGEYVCISVVTQTTEVEGIETQQTIYNWEWLGAESSFKLIQTEVADANATTSETTTTTFISSITQDVNGVIAVTKSQLDTSDTWTGTAAKVTTIAAETTELLSLIGVTGATPTVMKQAGIQVRNDSIVSGQWNGTTIDIQYGGTGNTTFTNNRLLFVNTVNNKTQFVSSSHYISDTVIGINKTTLDGGYSLEVQGSALFTGNLNPSANNTYYLGDNTSNNEKRWKGVFIGTDNSYGNAYTPIYWNNGVPTVATGTTVRIFFTLAKDHVGVKLSSAAITANSYILQLVITSGFSYLNAPITSTHVSPTQNAEGYIQLNTAIAVSDTVEGYIIIARGSTLSNSGNDSVTSTDISNT